MKDKTNEVCTIQGFTDIHTHVLHSVDDGPDTLEEAVALIRLAWKYGTRTMVFTPHFRVGFRSLSQEWINERFQELKDFIAKDIPGMKLFLGREVRCEVDIGDVLEKGAARAINGSNYVLLEFSTSSLRSEIISGVAEVFRNGYVPIIAHIERYEACRKDDDLVNEVLSMGALIQVNADSVLGQNGLPIKRFCRRLLESGCVHFIASDAHDYNKRPPLLRECFLHVHKKYGPSYAAQLFYHNAQAIINNAPM